MNEYYVYVLLDPRKPGTFVYDGGTFSFEPFYVGKGKGYRYKHHAWAHLRGQPSGNSYKARKIKNIYESGLEPLVKRKYCESESKAFELEIRMIKSIGRGSKGPLTNLSDGGEGQTGTKWTDKARKKKSKQVKEHYQTLDPARKEEIQKKRNSSLARVKDKIGQNVSKAFAKQTPRMKNYLSKVHSKISKEYWATVSDEVRKEHGLQVTENYSKWRRSVSDTEFKNAMKRANQKRAEARANRTPKQIADFKRKLSEGVKRAYAEGRL
jgi:hypothetical protein